MVRRLVGAAMLAPCSPCAAGCQVLSWCALNASRAVPGHTVAGDCAYAELG